MIEYIKKTYKENREMMLELEEFFKEEYNNIVGNTWYTYKDGLKANTEHEIYNIYINIQEDTRTLKEGTIKKANIIKNTNKVDTITNKIKDNIKILEQVEQLNMHDNNYIEEIENILLDYKRKYCILYEIEQLPLNSNYIQDIKEIIKDYRISSVKWIDSNYKLYKEYKELEL